MQCAKLFRQTISTKKNTSCHKALNKKVQPSNGHASFTGFCRSQTCLKILRGRKPQWDLFGKKMYSSQWREINIYSLILSSNGHDFWEVSLKLRELRRWLAKLSTESRERETEPSSSGAEPGEQLNQAGAPWRWSRADETKAWDKGRKAGWRSGAWHFFVKMALINVKLETLLTCGFLITWEIFTVINLTDFQPRITSVVVSDAESVQVDHSFTMLWWNRI